MESGLEKYIKESIDKKVDSLQKQIWFLLFLNVGISTLLFLYLNKI